MSAPRPHYPLPPLAQPLFPGYSIILNLVYPGLLLYSCHSTYPSFPPWLSPTPLSLSLSPTRLSLSLSLSGRSFAHRVHPAVLHAMFNTDLPADQEIIAKR